jgi:hypothetical protein
MELKINSFRLNLEEKKKIIIKIVQAKRFIFNNRESNMVQKKLERWISSLRRYIKSI